MWNILKLYYHCDDIRSSWLYYNIYICVCVHSPIGFKWRIQEVLCKSLISKSNKKKKKNKLGNVELYSL